VLGALAALESDPGIGARARELLSIVRRNVELEARLVDDLLDATRIVHGKLPLVRAPVDLHAVAGEVLASCRDAVERKGLEVAVALGAARHHVWGDDVRLRQVLANLLGNAVKFAAAGGHVALRSWNDGGALVVEVSDDGVGVGREDLQRLFQPFEQLADAGRREGLGLGLAICKGIVDLHGGRIHASSEGLGRGSRFVVELATIDPPADPPAAREAPGPAAADPPASGRLLLVDDHADTALVLSWVLERAGYTVTTAGTMRDALKLPPRDFDLLVSDIGLPDGSGLDLMRRMRRKGLRGIALSGYGTERDVRSSREAGFDLHLTKPVEMNRLLAAIGSLMKAATSAPEGKPGD
jgi:CheY-like chemotaxis protein